MKTVVKRRPFGKNGPKISEVSFGAMNLRMLKDLDLARGLIGDILDQGVNCIDTARGYNSEPGSVPMIESEVLLGEVISAREDAGEPLLIITKGHGYTPETFHTHLDESTERLRITRKNGKLRIGATDVYLCYLLHGINGARWDGIFSSGVLDCAKRLQSEGRFDFFGFSSHYGDAEVIHKAILTGKFDACELPYNVYNPALGEEGAVDLIKLAHERGMGVINMKAYNGSGSVPIFKQLRGITGIGYRDMTRFSLSNPYISTIDAGVRSIAEYLENAAASDMPPLTAEERSDMRERARKASPHLNTICRECMHCLEKFECPEGVRFPHILGTHGRFLVSRSLGFETAAYKDEYAAAARDSGECARCGQCLQWCEYHLDIPELLANAATDLGANAAADLG